MAAVYSAAVLLFPALIGAVGSVRTASCKGRPFAGDTQTKSNASKEPSTAIGKNDAESFVISVLDEKSGKVQKWDTEEYLVGVLAAEMPVSFELEALKAQAVAARSYIISRMNSRPKKHPSADVCTSSAHCKAWLSDGEMREKFGKSYDEYTKKLRGAVFATAGEYMEYDGNAVEAFFFASSGGRTENSEEVWGGSLPYLKSVASEGEELAAELSSETAVGKDEFFAVMESAGAGADCTIGAIWRTEGGSVSEIEIGGKRFRGTKIRQLFGLKSANFTVKDCGDEVVFSVKGSGHGVGMSQFGANLMAKQGKKYTEILMHYYTNIQIVKK